MSSSAKDVKDIKDKKHRRNIKATDSISPDPKKQKSVVDGKQLAPSARALFYAEETEADRRDPDEDMDLHRRACDELRRVMDSIKALKEEESTPERAAALDELRVHGTLQFITLRKLNRLAHFRCKKVRETTNEAKSKIDLHHLKLQNLLYEMMHLQKEINKCLDFKSKDEEIDLVDQDDFYSNAPESISRPHVTKKDTHQLTLARLDYELDQRKKLSEQCKEACKQKEGMSEEIKTKRDYLDGLQPKLSTILQVTKPVQDYLGMPFDEVREQHKTAGFLPRPLYVLYMQATAYRDACDKYMTASIQGDVEVAKAMEGTTLDIDEDDEDSDQEETEKDTQKRRRRTSCSDHITARREKLLKKHPLSVVISVTCKDESELTLTFSYMVVLEIVTVEVKLTANESSVSASVAGEDLLSPDGLLRCLYPEDYGLETPNPSNKYALHKLGMGEFAQYVHRAGHPYLWTQWLCGLQFLSLSQEGAGASAPDTKPATVVRAQVSLSAIHMEATVKKLRKRIRARMSLQRQLAALEQGTVVVGTEYQHLYPAKITSQLLQWKAITHADFMVTPRSASFAEPPLVNPEDYFYSALIQRGDAKLHTLVVISPDYPIMPPLFSLRVEGSTSGRMQDVKDMEAEVNIHCNELVKNMSHDQLLTNQLQRLLMCFDVYLETECEGRGAPEFPREKIYSRSCRGPARSKPFKFNPQLGFFSQR